MRFRGALFVVVACLCFVVVMVAASSGPVELGRVPPPPPRTSVPGDDAPVAAPSEESGDPQAPPGILEVPNNTFVAALVGVVLVAFALSVLHALFVTVRELLPLLRRRERPARADIAALPEIERAAVELDVERQLTALATGQPRNAIVACWLQLEDDVARAGLPRHAAETSAEFTTRVLASYSLDPTPVAELASLYREARFSAHPMEQADRDRALAALRLVHAALATPMPAVSGVRA